MVPGRNAQGASRETRKPMGFQIKQEVHPMNRKDLDRLFTQQVAELMNQGYTIHTGTMAGSQGEVAKVDLSRDGEVLRVLMTRTSLWEGAYDDIISIKVGRSTDKLRSSWDATIWNNNLEIISEIKLAKVTDNFFTTLEESKRMAAVRYERWLRKHTCEQELGETYKSVALRFLRRQPRMKTCTLDDIESMTRSRTKNGQLCYRIRAKRNTYTLGA